LRTKNLLFVIGSIRNVQLCVKNILPQDVGAAPMTLLVAHFRSRSIEQSTHLSVCSDAKKANWVIF
jgi:hypothetical protein